MYRSPLTRQARLTSNFISHRNSGRNGGDDLVYADGNSLGQPVVAVTKSKVIGIQLDFNDLKDPKREGEKWVLLRDVVNPKISFMYLHCQDINVGLGQVVEAGQQVGTMGYSGYTIPDNVPAGTHLHFEVRENNVRVNPIEYVDYNNFGGSQSNISSSVAFDFDLYHNDKGIWVKILAGEYNGFIEIVRNNQAIDGVTIYTNKGSFDRNIVTAPLLQTPYDVTIAGKKITYTGHLPVFVPPTIIEIPKTQPQPEAIITPAQPTMPTITSQDPVVEVPSELLVELDKTLELQKKLKETENNLEIAYKIIHEKSERFSFLQSWKGAERVGVASAAIIQVVSILFGYLTDITPVLNQIMDPRWVVITGASLSIVSIIAKTTYSIFTKKQTDVPNSI